MDETTDTREECLDMRVMAGSNRLGVHAPHIVDSACAGPDESTMCRVQAHPARGPTPIRRVPIISNPHAGGCHRPQ